MNGTLVKVEAVAVDNQSYPIQIFELKTMRGMLRYSAEVVLAPGDCVIFDDDSVTGLEARAARVIPATVYSRTLARTA